jgi:hypothetical protein
VPKGQTELHKGTGSKTSRTTDNQTSGFFFIPDIAGKERMGRSIIGQEQVVERLLLTLLCNGNLLLEGLPGLAKTRVFILGYVRFGS